MKSYEELLEDPQYLREHPSWSRSIFKKKSEVNHYDSSSEKIRDVSKNELRRRNLCFTYKEAWEPNHICIGEMVKVLVEEKGIEGKFGKVENASDEPDAGKNEDEVVSSCPSITDGYKDVQEIKEESNVSSGMYYNSFFVGNLEVRLDKTGEMMVTLDDSKCNSNDVPLFLYERCMAPFIGIVELDEPISVLTPNDDEDNSIFGPNAAQVLDQQVCQEDIIEAVDCENQVPQGQSDNSSCEAEVVHTPHSPHSLWNQLKVNEDGIVAALSHHDEIHKLVENYIWMIQLERRQKGIEAVSSLDSLQMIKEGMGTIKTNYLHLLSDRDHLLNLVEIDSNALRRKEEEIDDLCL
ncbi:hypothetical protein SUGI_0983470 [Cryptomeria japonica]|nr:hypothetical protein SUGI_0983470 [Cryptomeria japonica]